MTTQKQLLSSDIQALFFPSTYINGRNYYAAGRVLNLGIVDKGELFVQLSASVRGRDVIPYKQNIRLTWRNNRLASISGNCTCPVGHDCKHIVAVCLMYQFSQQNVATKASCLDWLDSFDKTKDQEEQPQDFIVYTLSHSHTQNQQISVELAMSRPKKAGGLAKGRKQQLHLLNYFYQSDKKYLREHDEDIIRLLTRLEVRYGDAPTLSGAIGFFTLQKMLATGRLFWQDYTQHRALTAGDDKNLAFKWQQDSDGDYQLMLAIAPSVLILTDPPQYIDPVTNTVGGFANNDLTVEQLKKYLNAPRVPEKYADEFSNKLALTQRTTVIPPPKEIAMTEIDNANLQLKLKLVGEQLEPSYQHFIALNFNYGGHQVSAQIHEPFTVLQTKQGLLRLRRDIEAEQQAIAQLADWGFYALEANADNNQALLLTSTAKSPLENTAHWSNFLQEALPDLQQQGWLIEQDDSFKLQFQQAESWEADIGDSQNDWFEMRFTVDINGLSYPLLPLIMPVLEHYALDGLPDTLNLPLGDHQFLSVPSEKLRPILTVLMELFNTSHLNADGSLKISRFNVASLANLEQHHYGLFSLTGGQQLRELAQKLNDFTGIATAALPDNFQAELRPYQQQGLNWLQFLREYQFAGILADDMGLGKTIQTLAHLLIEKQSGRMTAPCLIVAPTSLMSNWRREAARFTPDLTVLILQGMERKQHFDKINDYDIVLTTYPLLPRDEEVLLGHNYHYLILDEAQVVKNPTSIAAQLVRKIKTQHRLCLTGTPMENHLGELWTQFDFLMPHFLGDNSSFKKNYRTPIEQQGDNARKAQLSRRIAPFMLRRTKQAVATELPAKTEIIRTVSLHPKQAVLYESIRLTMEQKVRDAIAERGLARSHITILDALLKLRQTCCDPRTLPLEAAKKIKESAKLDLLMEMLPEQLEEGRRILVFSQFTRMIALIEDELNARKIAYTKLTGQTKKRDEAIEHFKSGAVDVFLISLKAGGVGLNLTEADTVIIYDPWWNPAAESQATDRAHRIGQDKPVFVYKLVTENTVEEKIIAMQERKRALADSVYSDSTDEASLTFSGDELTALFSPL
jgi:superfamily II DNA or RNA helicase